jgi:GT2 family glycosyltransferase
MSIKLSIVIPVFNQWVYTRYCLENFKNLNSNYELVIVDNGSTDETIIGITPYLKNPNLNYIRNQVNTGFGHACGQGFYLSKGEAVLFLNNDIKIHDKSLLFLDAFTAKVLATPDTLIGPTAGLVDKVGSFVHETNNEEDEYNYMSGWCLAATKKTWNKLVLPNLIGPFDYGTYFAYFEDTDVSLRAEALGMKFELYELPMTHIGRQTSKTMNLSKLYSESKTKFLKQWKGKI